MDILISLIAVSILWCGWCWLLYTRRAKEVIIVDFDSVIADISPIIKRSKIYSRNNPDKNINDYILAHINEQQPIESGIKKVWDFQRQSYKVVFITNRREYLRLETANFLNKWGLKGELYMQDFGDIGSVEKIWLAQYYRAKKFRVVGLLDWSNNAAEVSNQANVKIL